MLRIPEAIHIVGTRTWTQRRVLSNGKGSHKVCYSCNSTQCICNLFYRLYTTQHNWRSSAKKKPCKTTSLHFFYIYHSVFQFKWSPSINRCMGQGGRGVAAPPKIWATQNFCAARKIWAKLTSKEVYKSSVWAWCYFFFRREIFYFKLKSAWQSQLNSHEIVVT